MSLMFLSTNEHKGDISAIEQCQGETRARKSEFYWRWNELENPEETHVTHEENIPPREHLKIQKA